MSVFVNLFEFIRAALGSAWVADFDPGPEDFAVLLRFDRRHLPRERFKNLLMV